VSTYSRGTCVYAGRIGGRLLSECKDHQPGSSIATSAAEAGRGRTFFDDYREVGCREALLVSQSLRSPCCVMMRFTCLFYNTKLYIVLCESVRCVTTRQSEAVTAVEASVGGLMGGLKRWPWPLRMGSRLRLAVWRAITMAWYNHENPRFMQQHFNGMFYESTKRFNCA